MWKRNLVTTVYREGPKKFARELHSMEGIIRYEDPSGKYAVPMELGVKPDTWLVMYPDHATKDTVDGNRPLSAEERQRIVAEITRASAILT